MSRDRQRSATWFLGFSLVVATAAIAPAPGARLPPPDGVEVVEIAIRATPYGSLRSCHGGPLENWDFQAPASLFEPSQSASPETLPIVETSGPGGPLAFVEPDR